MIDRRTGFVAGAALAAGLAIGLAGNVLAANPTASPGHPSVMNGRGMMGGHGMMGGASFAPGSTYGPGLMGSLAPDQWQQMLERCDRIHDTMHDGQDESPSPSKTPAPR
jgi:hypothetical protein